jgi:hypothetical protein
MAASARKLWKSISEIRISRASKHRRTEHMTERVKPTGVRRDPEWAKRVKPTGVWKIPDLIASWHGFAELLSRPTQAYPRRLRKSCQANGYAQKTPDRNACQTDKLNRNCLRTRTLMLSLHNYERPPTSNALTSETANMKE